MSDAVSSEVVWTAPFICAPVAITVTVSDAFGSEVAHTFTAIADMPLAEVDIPDGDYIDADCDGIDGDIDHAFFVSPSGDDAGAGTQLDPFLSIGHAIAQAAVHPVRWQVLVSAGIYAETVALADGVGIFGQYDGDGGWSRGTGNAAVIDSSAAVGVHVASTSLDGYIEGFHIRTADAEGADSSTRAVILEDLGAAFYLRHNELKAGRGADGARGSEGAAGSSGAPGGNGSGGVGGGGGAPAASCGGGGGGGGQGGCLLCGAFPCPTGGGGGGGGGGSGGSGGGGGQGGGGSFGVFAINASLAVITDNTITTAGGGHGGDGGQGGQGGGGGQGGSGTQCVPGFAGAGSPGGHGGAGGHGGQGGGGGGGMSVGIMQVSSPELSVGDNLIVLGTAGTGGAGGDPGATGIQGEQILIP